MSLTWHSLSAEHATGGNLSGPENLYENITKSSVASIDNSFPASKGNVRATAAKVEAVNAKLEADEAEAREYRNKTTVVIDLLIGKLNNLTPVGIWLDPLCTITAHTLQSSDLCPVQGYNGTNGENGFNGTMGMLTYHLLARGLCRWSVCLSIEW